jgi:hypothetical protein
MKASEIEPFFPLTQPLLGEEADPQPSAAEEPQEPKNEVVCADDVD